MYCIHCGQENDPSARFCMACGKPMPKPKPEPTPAAPGQTESAPAPPYSSVAPPEPKPKAVPVAAPQSGPHLTASTTTQSRNKPSPNTANSSLQSKFSPQKNITQQKPVVRERCPVCGFSIRTGIHYCEGCGIPLNLIRLTTCKTCGFVNRSGTAFCENCGNNLGMEPWEGDRCPSCGYPNRLGIRFCEGCGVSFQAQAETAAREKQQTVTQLRKLGFKMVWRYILPRVLGGSVSGFILGKLGQWVFQNGL